MISVIIPTYREPEYLDLCLRSAIEGQRQKNQIIVVVDGYFDENKNVLEKYPQIEILHLEQNVGLPKATNLGVYNAKYEWVLIVNDDNVFPKNWDEKLERWRYLHYRFVVSPNQIEPYPSIFKEFIIRNCGIDPNNFDLEKFWEIAEDLKKETKYINNKGGTLPIFIKKKNYLVIGGWDENYPTTGVVADWDFFHKCKLNGMDLVRDFDTNFYHFVSKATVPTPQQIQNRQQQEYEGHEYGKYKWGNYLTHNLLNGS